MSRQPLQQTPIAAAVVEEVLPVLRRALPIGTASRVRGARRPLNPADIDMFAAIVGRSPTDEERERALAPPPPDEPTPEPASVVQSARAWSPGLLCAHLRSMCHTGLAFRVSRPQLTGWVKRVSGEAIRRFETTPIRRRLAKVALRPRGDESVQGERAA